MPILNLRVEGKQGDRTIPAPHALMETGPIIQVQLTVLDDHAEILKGQGKRVPSVEGHVMVDTGAKRTAVDIELAKQVGLPVSCER